MSDKVSLNGKDKYLDYISTTLPTLSRNSWNLEQIKMIYGYNDKNNVHC